MRFGVLVSGSGTNLQALLDAAAVGGLAPGELACVISNRADAFALTRAVRAGVPAHVVRHEEHVARPAFEDALLAVLAAHAVDAVLLAGFMRVLTPHFLERFPDRVLNVHPALLPAFPGTAAPAQALAHGVKLTGCTVHLVDDTVDGGAIVLQGAVPVLPGDDVVALTARIQAEEHVLFPRAAQLLAAGRLRRAGRIVTVS